MLRMEFTAALVFCCLVAAGVGAEHREQKRVADLTNSEGGFATAMRAVKHLESAPQASKTVVARKRMQPDSSAWCFISELGDTARRPRCASAAVWGLRAAAHVHGTPSSGVEMMLKEDSSANLITPKWALEMGRNLPLVKPADRADGKVHIYIVNRSFIWMFMALRDQLFDNVPDRSVVRQQGWVGQTWELRDKHMRQLLEFEVTTIHNFTVFYGNQLVTIPAYATPDEQTAKPWLHTILNNTGYKPVAHYVKRPLWATEMGRWVPELANLTTADTPAYMYVVNYSPYRWWMTLGNNRYNSVPPRATARQVVYKAQVWSFTDRDKKMLDYFKYSTMGSVTIEHADQAIIVPPHHLKWRGSMKKGEDTYLIH